jgi:dienelactone hydrolase
MIRLIPISITAAVVTSLVSPAQTTNTLAPIRPGQPPDMPMLTRAVQSSFGAAQVAGDIKAQADQLITESSSLPPSEARRRLAKALTLLRGQAWDAKREFLWSLTLRADRIIADSSHPSLVWLAQIYTAPYTPADTLKLKLSLAPDADDAKPIRDLGTFEIFLRDLVDRPYPVSATADGIADGAYRIVAELFEGDASLGSLQNTIRFVHGIDARRAEVERRLVRIEGHESTKASIRYPFDLARVINIGKKNLNEFDLGLNEQRRPNWPKFAELMKRSEELLAALEAGRDPLWRAKGDTQRHYWFAEAGEIMPYRLYVPTTWDGLSQLPMVLILHGNTRDQDFYFDRDRGIIPNHGEKHGYLLVCPLGYHPNGGYNSGMLGQLAGLTSAAAPGAAQGRGRAGGRGGGGSQFANDMPRSRLGELSEQDAMRVFELVRSEYPIDPKRTFLFGYSAGGAGTLYFGPKYSSHWAAIAAGGSNVGPNNYPFDRLTEKNIPVHIFFGDQDSAGVLQASRNLANAMKERGLEVDLAEYKGFNHDTAPGAAIPHLFDFFNAHPRP